LFAAKQQLVFIHRLPDPHSLPALQTGEDPLHCGSVCWVCLPPLR